MRWTGALLSAVLLCAPMALSAGGFSVPTAPTQWVTDGVGLLSQEQCISLDRKLEALQKETGHQVIVWIGQSLDGEALEPWAARAFQQWGIGQKGKDNGVAWFLFVADRKMRIEVGYGFEEKLTDARAAQILREVAPLLKKGDAYGALQFGVSKIVDAIDPGHTGESSPSWSGEALLVFLAPWVTMALILFWIYASRLSHSTCRTKGSFRRGGFSSYGGGSSSGGGFRGGGGSSGGGGASGGW